MQLDRDRVAGPQHLGRHGGVGTAVPTSGSAAIRSGSPAGSGPRTARGVASASRSSPEPSITCTDVVATSTGAAAYRASVPW